MGVVSASAAMHAIIAEKTRTCCKVVCGKPALPCCCPTPCCCCCCAPPAASPPPRPLMKKRLRVSGVRACIVVATTTLHPVATAARSLAAARSIGFLHAHGDRIAMRDRAQMRRTQRVGRIVARGLAETLSESVLIQHSTAAPASSDDGMRAQTMLRSEQIGHRDTVIARSVHAHVCAYTSPMHGLREKQRTSIETPLKRLLSLMLLRAYRPLNRLLMRVFLP